MKEAQLFRKVNNKKKQDDEKSKLQEFEEDVKLSIFSVFYLLLKNHESTYWKFIVLIVLEYFQLLSFSFDKSVRFYTILDSIDGNWLEI